MPSDNIDFKLYFSLTIGFLGGCTSTIREVHNKKSSQGKSSTPLAKPPLRASAQ